MCNYPCYRNSLFLYVFISVYTLYFFLACPRLSLCTASSVSSIPGSAFQRAYKGMIQKIIASINKLKMKQRGVYFIDFSRVQWQF